MRAAFIYPPFSKSIQTTLPEFVNENEGCFPPLGVIYVASYLKEHEKDCDILVIDSVCEKLDYNGIGEKVSAFSPDIVGISCWTFSLVDALEVAREVKRRKPSTYVCLGGPHVTIYPEETVSFEEVDFVITGDGEKPFAELVRQLKGGGSLSQVPNLYYKEKGKIHKNHTSYSETDLDSLPFPDRTFTPIASYYSIMDRERPVTTMVTSRGCPFQCTFCFQQDTGWRYRSASSIIAEMERCIDLGIKNFFIFDETFTVNKKRVIDLCDEIKKRKLKITWSCRSRVDTIDEEIMDKLKEAGCQRISFGVEAANEAVLKRLDKKIKISQARKVFKWMKNKGLISLADFMIGCPEEDKDKTYETIKLAIELDPDYAQFSLLTLFPATTLYKEALKEGVIKKDVWLEFAKNPNPAFEPPLWNIYSKEEAKRLLAVAYRTFYIRLSYILKRAMKIRSASEFSKYAKAGISLIKSALKGGG